MRIAVLVSFTNGGHRRIPVRSMTAAENVDAQMRIRHDVSRTAIIDEDELERINYDLGDDPAFRSFDDGIDDY